ncbi:MAG: hypothetical protein M3N21_06860 [Actinomycetota bacterium]|nr:hypothetical protein [Actinomycetota bacterium]
MTPLRRPELVAIAAVLPTIALMGVPAGVVGLGVVGGAALAMQATGIVLVYRSARFINFAQIQIGAVAATLFTVLVHGQAVFRSVHALCPPCLERVTPAEIDANYAAALVAGLALAVGLSWLIYAIVVRRLERAPRLVATVASLFLITLLAGVQRLLVSSLTTSTQRDFGGATRAAPPPLQVRLVVGPARFSTADLLTVLLAAVLLAGTGWYLARSRTGTDIRAVADNADRAQQLGLNIDRVQGRVWVIVGALSGVTGLLAAMAAPAADGTTTVGGSSLVNVLLVVVLARFASLPIAVTGALAFSVLSQAVAFRTGSTALLDGSLVLVVSGLLLLQRPERGRADRDTSSAYLAGRVARPVPRALLDLPSVRTARRSGALIIVSLLVAAPFLLSPSQTSTVSTTVLYAIVGLSLLVLTGWAGQVSLGQFSFAAVGAYTVAVTGLPVVVAIPLAAAAGACVAVVVGLPALRLSGTTLAVSTLALAVSTTAVLLNPDRLGSFLPAELPRPLLFGISLDNQRAFYALSVACLALAAGAVAGLRRSRTARALLACRDNEAAAQSFGINVLRVRITAFALSGAIAAIAGGLFAYQQAHVAPDAFSVDQSLLIFTFTVIGGLGSLVGPLVGFAVLAILALTTHSPGWYAAVMGLGGLSLLLLAPGGLAQVGLDVRDGLLRRVAARHAIPTGLGGPSTDVLVPLLPGPRRVMRRYELPDQWSAHPAARAAAETHHD